METKNKSDFILSAKKSGWMPILVFELIDLCGDFDGLLKISNDTGEAVLNTVVISSINTTSEEQLPTDPLLIFLKHECISKISVDRAVLFYEEHYDDIARSLWLSSVERGYDRYLAISNIAPSLPADFIPVFWRGYGQELLNNNFESDLSSKLLCRYVVVYTVYMLIYEFQIYLETLRKP